MNCTSFREAVHEMDREGLLDDSAYDAAVAHAQICTRCARLLSQSRQLDASLKAMARADSRCEASARVYGQTLRAFREQAPTGLYTPRAIGWLAAAAAVLILAGGALIVWRRMPAPRPEAARAVASAPARPADRPSAASPAANGPAGAVTQPESLKPTKSLASAQVKAHAPKSVLKANGAGESDEFEDLADFIPLPYADDDAPLGTGELVRVRLPESALGLLGFPISDASSSEPVTADVVIGEDGVARAIRFVSGPVPAELAELRTSTFENKGAKP